MFPPLFHQFIHVLLFPVWRAMFFHYFPVFFPPARSVCLFFLPAPSSLALWAARTLSHITFLIKPFSDKMSEKPHNVKQKIRKYAKYACFHPWFQHSIMSLHVVPSFSGWWFQPLWKRLVSWDSWDDEIPNVWKTKFMFQTTNQFSHDFPIFTHFSPTFLAISWSSAPFTVTRITCCVPSPLRTTWAARSRQSSRSAWRKTLGGTPWMWPLEMRTVVSLGLGYGP